jgi:hypothetical protein
VTTVTRPLPPHGTEPRYCGSKTRPCCRCQRCTRAARLANIRRAQIRAAYGSNTIPRDHLAAHVHELLDAGMSQAGIARAAGVSPTTISYIVLGKLHGCHRDKAVRILAVQPTLDNRSPQPAIGTIRRVRALYAIGHGQAAIAATTGLSESAISHIASAFTSSVTGATAAKIRAAYRVLCARPGTSRKARARAAEQGWLGPLAWDDIDNPEAEPETDTGTVTCLGTYAEARHRAAEIRHLAGFGLSHEEIAARVSTPEKKVRPQYVREVIAGHGPGWREQQEVAA